MAYQSINSSEIEAGKPTKESLFSKIKNNLDYHESQIEVLSGGTGQTVVFNQLLKFPEIPIGSPIWTWDTLTNIKASGFSKQWIDCSGSGTWVDGGGVTRSTPDARNRFLRMYNAIWTVATNLTYPGTTKLPTNPFTGTSNNPNTSSITGGDHTHFIANTDYSNTVNSYLSQYGNSGDQAYELKGSSKTPTMYTTSSNSHTHLYNHTHTFTVSGGGDSETAPVHIYLNLLFKKGYSWGSFRLLYKSSSSFTVTTVNLTKIEAGAAASTVTMDIRKATTAQLSSGSGSVSILSTLATITDDGSTSFVEAAGVIKTDGTENIATNDWLYVDFTSKISGASEYHVQVVGN
jgi:hypothetical protein